jgi:GT2 family glycosyltransferase
MELTRSASPLQLEFDQYHRYAAVALLLKPLLASLDRPARLLDIQGTSLQLLTDFLSPLRMEVTQAHLTPNRDHGTILLPQDEPVPLPDQSVDFTLALEALEQVPAEDRTYCVSEWLRVAREGILISCPLTRGVRRKTPTTRERPVRRRKNLLPLPTASQPPTTGEVRGLLDKLGLNYVMLAPVAPAEWLPLLVLLEENHPLGSAKLVGVLQQLLKMRLFRTFTHQRPYRRLFLAWKTGAQAKAAQAGWFPQQLPTTPPLRGSVRDEGTVLHPVMTLASRLSASFAAPVTPTTPPQIVETASPPPTETWQRQLGEQQAALDRWQREQAWREWRLVEELTGFAAEVHTTPAPGMASVEPYDLCPVPANAHLWEARSSHAHFRWQTNLPSGWLRLQLRGRGLAGQTVRVLLRHGEQETSLLLGRWHQEDTLVRYLFCEHPVTEIQLFPGVSQGPVRIDHWEVVPSSKSRACFAGLGRLLADGWTVAGMAHTVRTVAKAWWQGGWRGLGKLCLGRALQPRRPPDADQEPLTYSEWITHEECIEQERDKALARLCQLPELPTLAVLMPIPPDTNNEALKRTLGSLAEQGYPRVEFLLAAASPDVPRVRALLAEYPALTVTTRLHVPAHSLHHIPIVLNELLEQARSEHCALVTVGDRLGREALLFLADALGQHPAADVLYTDEDRWSSSRGRHSPTFKPAWSPDHFLATGYTGNLTVFRSQAIRQAGGFSDRWPLGYDLDMICRLAQADGTNIVHVPKVLYHRVEDTPAKTMQGARATSHASQETKSILTHHLQQGLWGLWAEKGRENFRLAMKGTPKVSIIIPSAGKEVLLHGERTTHLQHCLNTLRQRTTYPHLEILVVSNGPLAPAVERMLQAQKVRRVEVPPPFHFSSSINAGTKQATGEYLLFLNDDTAVITPDWLEQMLAYATQPGIGVVGPKLLFPDGRLQHVGVALGARGPGHPFYGRKANSRGDCVRNCSAVTGACLLTARKVFEEVGGFGMEFPLNYNDVDYCLKVRQAGQRIVLLPQVELYHYEQERCDGHAPLNRAELEQFQRKWAAMLPCDPYENPNLCPWAGDGRLGRYHTRS